MRLLLDECVPRRLKRELRRHEAKTVKDMGWAGITNGALIKLADGQFDALLTVDQGIAYQQNLSGLKISVVVMLAASNDIDDLRPLLSNTRLQARVLAKSCEWVANLQMEPTRQTICAIMPLR